MRIYNHIDIIKLDIGRIEKWRYTGQVIKKTRNWIVLEATFDRPDVDFFGLQLAQGDRFIEIYFQNRWFNIYEVYDKNSHEIKGWYCNIATPAEIEKDSVSYVDLAIDLLVFPDGKQIVLDMDEFDALNLDLNTHHKATAALKELQSLFLHHPSFQILQWIETYKINS